MDGDKNANNHRANLALDYYLNRRLYLTLPSLEFFKDEFQNIESRFTTSVGLGYEIVDGSRVEWDVTGGLAHQRTEYDSGSSVQNDPALVFSTVFDLEVTDDLDWDSSYSLQLIVPDLDKINHHLESTLSFDIWGPIDFDVSFVWDRMEGPESDSDGSRPKKNDFRTTLGLAIEYWP